MLNILLRHKSSEMQLHIARFPYVFLVVNGLTESLGQVLEMILWKNKVGELRQSSDLLRQLFKLILRYVQLGQLLEVTQRLQRGNTPDISENRRTNVEAKKIENVKNVKSTKEIKKKFANIEQKTFCPNKNVHLVWYHML